MKLPGVFTEKDLKALKKRGVPRRNAAEQLTRLQDGFPPLALLRAATLGDGIMALDSHQINAYLDEFAEESSSLKLLKFVPASGAASRMFKALYEDLPANAEIRNAFLESLPKFPFYESLKTSLEKSEKDLEVLKKESPQELFDHLLNPEGLGFGVLPKGLIPFHNYPEGPRTAFEEHLYEGAHHSAGKDGVVRIHFTVQEEWLNHVQQWLRKKSAAIKRFNVTGYDLGFSVQSPATDTLALAEDDMPVRTDDGQLLFRPGGHGALIHNLNDLKADLIFVKNIDNIAIDEHKYQSLLYKKVLGGMAIGLRRSLYRFCKAIDQQRTPLSIRREMQIFLNRWLGIETPPDLKKRENKHAFLSWAHEIFDRPLRICAMVKNEGEPGGGPFWVQEKVGSARLQIVEKSQIDTDDPAQAEILAASTHFNPVDMVCMTQNYKGEPYNLLDFVDPETGFVSHKSLNGKNIKALELPGLWNGAMAYWNTIFVEVPVATFCPVKTVNDLLRPLHQ